MIHSDQWIIKRTLQPRFVHSEHTCPASKIVGGVELLRMATGDGQTL